MSSAPQAPKYNGNTVPLSGGGIGVTVTGIVMCTLATAWTGLRFYSRRYRRVPIHLEDWLILMALVGKSLPPNQPRANF